MRNCHTAAVSSKCLFFDDENKSEKVATEGSKRMVCRPGTKTGRVWIVDDGKDNHGRESFIPVQKKKVGRDLAV